MARKTTLYVHSTAEMQSEKPERCRENLLKHCGLDTFAMVRVWEKLKEAT